MSGSLFYDLPKLDQIAVNLFYGWGYNFYRAENQVRQDDQLVRQKASMLLGMANDSVKLQLAVFRRRFLKPPTKVDEEPDLAALEGAATLDALSKGISQLEATIRNMAVPENDRMTQRYRQELDTLVRLRGHDVVLIGRAQVLCDLVKDKSHEWLLANIADLEGGLRGIAEDINARRMILEI